MVYRPELSDQTKNELDEVKSVLKDRPRDGEHAVWRRSNMTFKVDYIIREALKSYRKEINEKWG